MRLVLCSAFDYIVQTFLQLSDVHRLVVLCIPYFAARNSSTQEIYMCRATRIARLSVITEPLEALTMSGNSE